MAYPPPPGLRNPSTQHSQSSLPARPPPTSAAPSLGAHSQPYGAFHAVASSAQEWRSNTPTAPVGPTAPPSYAGMQYGYGGGYQQANAYDAYQQPQQQQSYGPSAPQIHNPFPNPAEQGNYGQNQGSGRYGSASYDPEYEAQIAQWQSAYANKDEQSSNAKGGSTSSYSSYTNHSATGANTSAIGSRTGTTISAAPMSNQEIASYASGGSANIVGGGADGKSKTVVRSGGGTTWQDPSLLEWDPAHFRLFIGNLAGEVTDESLLKAFSKYPSVQKARVVRDKRTTKSKGYGFVSFSNGDEYFQAAKDMQGKYIGSHPVQVKKSNTEIKAVNQSDVRNRGKKGKGGQDGHAGHNANTGAGVQKKKQDSKMKGGLKLLG